MAISASDTGTAEKNNKRNEKSCTRELDFFRKMAYYGKRARRETECKQIIIGEKEWQMLEEDENDK